MISKNIRTHIVVLSDSREFLITNDQYNNLLLSIQDWKSNDLVKIIDADSNTVLFHGKSMHIKEFKEIKRRDTAWIHYFCDFWERHPLEFSCNCSEKYNIYPWEFRKNASQLFNKMYMQDLTDSEKNIVRSHCYKI